LLLVPACLTTLLLLLIRIPSLRQCRQKRMGASLKPQYTLASGVSQTTRCGLLHSPILVAQRLRIAVTECLVHTTLHLCKI